MLKPSPMRPASLSSSDHDGSDSSSHYTDLPESLGDSAPGTNFGFDSALTARSALPLSGFRTPQIASGRWSDRIKINSGGKTKREVKGENLADKGLYQEFDEYHDPYLSWSNEKDLPIGREDIENVFLELTELFGFQMDSTKNIFDYFMRLLHSRASRMSPNTALRSLHADYIGGPSSNFKKWYFAAQLDIDDTVGFRNLGRGPGSLKDGVLSLEESEKRWLINMSLLSARDSVVQLALYLLIWGEANNIRFMPECLCFIFKCCNDFYYGLERFQADHSDFNRPLSFLDHVITPLYEYYRDQVYEFVDGRYIVRDNDHSTTIGYDDINQFFWHRKGLEKIKILNTKKALVEIPSHERFIYLNQINWSKCFYKSYKERRTWLHVVVNFNRIWIIHCAIFWIYTMANSSVLFTKNYQQHLDNKPSISVYLSVLALHGSISTLINFTATVLEYLFVPRKWPGALPLTKRLIMLSLLFVLLTTPTLYIMGVFTHYVDKKLSLGLAITQFILSCFTTIYFALTPLALVFKSGGNKRSRELLPGLYFTNSVHKLSGKAKLSSYGLWIAVFTMKLIESYFFLTLSLKDPIRELSLIHINKCVGEKYIGPLVCRLQPKILLVLMCSTDLVLFFLDTYLWYIICNTFHSVCRSFYIGVSIWTPWRNVFSRLPKHIFSKCIASTPDSTFRSKILVSQIWNSIVISMYREHLLSVEHVHPLIYQTVTQTSSSGAITATLKEPVFFMSQDDMFMKSPMFESQSEAQRRIAYFAQSLSTPMPDPRPVTEMPTFSVLIPHFSEKITLTLREIIRQEEGTYSNVTLLEYLKKLHESEWNCFVQDTKMLADEYDGISSSSTEQYSAGNVVMSAREKADNLPYYSVGYKHASPEYTLRTRIWASLRSQTLYRTISGFMNYSRAIKLMYDVENPPKPGPLGEAEDHRRIEEAQVMAIQKFRMVVSMQRMMEFNQEERDNRDLLIQAYPELQICYLDEEQDASGNKIYYSSLIDGSCAIQADGRRVPKYRIRLSGNPILGDGKSDNQNHAVIFCRGEYIQLIDANQDNYLEECLKIRSVLAEFEESDYESKLAFSQETLPDITPAPVAIIGTREYIFSENIGILGDVAAGKEQTFGTLFARTLARIGGKLHYGHPDFLNTVFMTTRGGVSKAQKGLHLNEDIYAGINAILRGGRIKHCEYAQCGKGRDLGCGSILNFNTKIGAGMGEQMLSREYYYLGTQLPLDRFLSFYYAHPGFHLNNVFIIFSILMFLVVTVNLSALVHESVICEYNPHIPITDPRKPVGCSNLIPLIHWLERSVLSIFVIFFVAFVPLMVQELTERGVWKAFTRLGKHLLSLAPMFEVFVCKVYAQSLINDLAVGGARYIATGRGFATVRVRFYVLYSRFAAESFYFAASLLAMLIFCSVAMWNIVLLYFWMTTLALFIVPFLYNPNQFAWNEFFLDYRSFLKWMSTGNNSERGSSWIGHVRRIRIQNTGSKRKKLGRPGDNLASDFKKPSFVNTLFSQVLPRVLFLAVVMCAYTFMNSQNEVRTVRPANTLLRVLIFSLAPLVLNAAVLLILFFVSLIVGPWLSFCFHGFPSFMCAIAHTFALVNHVLWFELLWLSQNWGFKVTVLGFFACTLIQDLLFKVVITLFLTREFKHDRTNRAWWSGKWLTAGLGWGTFTQPLREYLCKIIEMSLFVADFFLGHFILFLQIPMLCVPYIDKWHSLMLFWLKPDRQLRPPVLAKKRRRRQRVTVMVYFAVFVLMLALSVAIFLAPYIVNDVLKINLRLYIPPVALEVFQPDSVLSPKKGLVGYYSRAKSGKRH
ncbi:CYFA0S12e03532g1_1 [Cyberlindnera fabianii]|uniref:1,3-beta-glucan synthase n=1 Tax=Cyberlindnera fabianii TaxID=36022 RepID=A0A061B1M1_CYBFA|nr:CYFA0S12e03532g1_1 [Cyberlindnera fabianii]